MRNSNLKNTLAMGFALVLGATAMASPIQAHAAKVPGTCDLVNNTLCGGAPSVLQQVLSLFSFA